jgi:hypothetical protein
MTWGRQLARPSSVLPKPVTANLFPPDNARSIAAGYPTPFDRGGSAFAVPPEGGTTKPRPSFDGPGPRANVVLLSRVGWVAISFHSE